MTNWYRVYAHPAGASPSVAEFVVGDDGLVFPVGERETPAEACFSIVGDLVYPTRDHPSGDARQPWYEVVGSFVYPAKGHPDGAASAPWYQVRAGALL